MMHSIKYNYLVNQYKNRIYSYAFYMLRNRMDADDISQEVFIRIWKNMGNFSLASARSWIMKTTHNLCLDYLRSRQSSLARFRFIDDDEEENVADEFLPEPDESAHSVIMQGLLDEAVGRLPVKLKSVFLMYEVQGFKYEDISRILEIPMNSVKVYLMRARKKLQSELRSYAPAEMRKNG